LLSLAAVILCLPAARAALPDAPLHRLRAATPLHSPAVRQQSLPQINQREADQSDDQENPAVFSITS